MYESVFQLYLTVSRPSQAGSHWQGEDEGEAGSRAARRADEVERPECGLHGQEVEGIRAGEEGPRQVPTARASGATPKAHQGQPSLVWRHYVHTDAQGVESHIKVFFLYLRI